MQEVAITMCGSHRVLLGLQQMTLQFIRDKNDGMWNGWLNKVSAHSVTQTRGKRGETK